VRRCARTRRASAELSENPGLLANVGVDRNPRGNLLHFPSSHKPNAGVLGSSATDCTPTFAQGPPVFAAGACVSHGWRIARERGLQDVVPRARLIASSDRNQDDPEMQGQGLVRSLEALSEVYRLGADPVLTRFC